MYWVGLQNYEIVYNYTKSRGLESSKDQREKLEDFRTMELYLAEAIIGSCSPFQPP